MKDLLIRFLLIITLAAASFEAAASVVVGTWNGNWFPSGRAEHRAPAAEEEATSRAAAAMLASGLAAVDPAGTNDIILCLNEIRGPRAASNLIERIGRPGLRLAVISGYRRRDRYDQQQDAIATTLPVVDRRWHVWKPHGKETPPRGYACAAVVITPVVTAEVYAVHLKSNYGSTSAETAELNRMKRTRAVEELLAFGRLPDGRYRRPVIIAGDMNADKWRREFSEERIFKLFSEAGFRDLVGRLPPSMRGTHPSRNYGDSTLDYVFVHGFNAVELPRIIPADGISDHHALFTLIRPL